MVSKPSAKATSVSINDLDHHLVMSANFDAKKQALSYVIAPETFYGRVLWFFFGKSDSSIKEAVSSYNRAREQANKTVQVLSSYKRAKKNHNSRFRRARNESMCAPTEATQASFSQESSRPSFSTPVTETTIIDAVMKRIGGPVQVFKSDINNYRQDKLNRFRSTLKSEMASLRKSQSPKSTISAEEAPKIYDQLLVCAAEKLLANYDKLISIQKSQDAKAIKSYNKNTSQQDFEIFWSDTKRLKDPVLHWAEKINLAHRMKEKFWNYPDVAKAWDERIKAAQQAYDFSRQAQQELDAYDAVKGTRSIKEKKEFIQQKLALHAAPSYYHTAWKVRLPHKPS